MTELLVVTEIDAPIARVWEILSDLAGYSRWNPFLRHLAGSLETGAPLETHVAFPGGRIRRLQARISAIQPGCALRWQAVLWKRRIFDVSYAFELEPLDPGGTLLTQRARFSGVLVPFLIVRITRITRHGLLEMNEALKAEVEDAVHAPILTWHG